MWALGMVVGCVYGCREWEWASGVGIGYWILLLALDIGVGCGHWVLAWALGEGMGIEQGHPSTHLCPTIVPTPNTHAHTNTKHYCPCPHPKPISNVNTHAQHLCPTPTPNTHCKHPCTAPMHRTHAQHPCPIPHPYSIATTNNNTLHAYNHWASPAWPFGTEMTTIQCIGHGHRHWVWPFCT